MKNLIILLFSVLVWGCTQGKENKDSNKSFAIINNMSKEYVNHIDSIKSVDSIDSINSQNGVPDNSYSSVESAKYEAKEAEKFSDKTAGLVDEILKSHDAISHNNMRIKEKQNQLNRIESSLDSSLKLSAMLSNKIDKLNEQKANTIARLEKENQELNNQELRYIKRKSDKLYAGNN